MNDPANTVRFSVADDDAARRIFAVLAALGFDPVRDVDLPIDAGRSLPNRVKTFAEQHQLTTRETSVLLAVVRGHSNARIADDAEISRATVKWHLHNLFAKTNTSTREALLHVVAFGRVQEPATPTDPTQGQPPSPNPTRPTKTKAWL